MKYFYKDFIAIHNTQVYAIFEYCANNIFITLYIIYENILLIFFRAAITQKIGRNCCLLLYVEKNKA
jgi:hypothetical protein